MNRRHVVLPVLVVLIIAAVGITGGFLLVRAQSFDTEEALMVTLADLASVEAHLDSLTLRVASLDLRQYDPVVALLREIGSRQRRLQDLLAASPGDPLPEAAAYGEKYREKTVILERLKGGAAFLRNEVTYIPFAVSQTVAVLGPEQSVILLRLSQDLLAYHAQPSEEGRQELRQAIDEARRSLAPPPAPILDHIQASLDEKEKLEGDLRRYFATDSLAALTRLRDRVMDLHLQGQRRAVLVSRLLSVLAVVLLLGLLVAGRSLVLARAAAERASARLTDAVHNMQGAFALFDARHRLLLYNGQWELFYPPLQGQLAVGMPYEGLLRLIAQADFVTDAIDDGEAWIQRELAGLHDSPPPRLQDVADGRRFLCSDRETSDGGLVSIRADITAQKKTEEALRRLSVAVEQSPVSIVITDLDGTIQYVNPRFTEATGYEREEAVGANPRILKSDSTPAALYQSLWQAISSGQIWHGELQNRRKDGSLFWERASISPIRDEAGRLTGYVGVKEDISEQKASAARLEAMMEELARSNAELERFAYIASHDLQEPLRSVASFSQILARRYQGRLDAEADEFIGYITAGARRMQQLVRDLLTFSRVTTRAQPFAAVDLAEVVTVARDNLSQLAADTGAEITVSPLPVLCAERGQMVQLFQNLLGNALKFHRPGQPPQIAVSARRQEREWLFSVRDDGIGIAPADHQRVFEIFQRLHTQEEYPGTGIGLALCKRIVEHHQGRIFIRSEVGQGTEVCFTLPAEEG